MEDRTANEVQLRIKAGWAVFCKYKEIFQNKEIPICFKQSLQSMYYRYPNNDLRLSNMVTYKRHNQNHGSMSEKNVGPETDRIPDSTIRERTKVDVS